MGGLFSFALRAGERQEQVRADKQTPWDPIAQIVAELGEAKYEVKMVTAPMDSAREPR